MLFNESENVIVDAANPIADVKEKDISTAEAYSHRDLILVGKSVSSSMSQHSFMSHQLYREENEITRRVFAFSSTTRLLASQSLYSWVRNRAQRACMSGPGRKHRMEATVVVGSLMVVMYAMH